MADEWCEHTEMGWGTDEARLLHDIKHLLEKISVQLQKLADG